MLNLIAPRRRGRRLNPATSRRPSLERLEARELMTAAPTPLLVQLRAGTTLDVGAIAAASGATAEPTGVPDLFRATGTSAALNRMAGGLTAAWQVRYVEPERTFHVSLAPTDPKYADGSLWGLNGPNGVNAPAAWDVSTGSAAIVVASIDTGVDYRHQDLYKNIWINQAEIPVTRKANLVDTDGDSRFTFYDLNDAQNKGPGKISDANGDGRIDGTDLLATMIRDADGLDIGLGGWADGKSNDGDAYVDDLVGWNFVNNTNNPHDDHGHGTHTAGTMGASANNGLGVVGLNWKVQIMPLKFLDVTGSGSDSDGAAAILYAAQHGAQVSNNSYGGGDGGTPMGDAIATAATLDHVFVAAAGNERSNTDAVANFPSTYASDNIVAVAAIDSSGTLAGFSNYGLKTVDIGAPGVGILSTIPSGLYGMASGTSMAAPHAAGVVALVRAAYPTWTYKQVIQQVLSSARPSAAMAGKSVTGGVLDAARALAPSNSATFVGADATTKGDWSPTYGKNGRMIAVDGSVLPANVTVTTQPQSSHTWSAATTELRALRRGAGTGRIAATWFASSSLTYDLKVAAGASQQVSIYALDWDYQGRSQRVDILDAASGAVLDTRTLSSFTGGVYLNWNLTGHVKIKVTRLGGPNAVVSGLFFSELATPPTPPPTPPAPLAGNNKAAYVGFDTATKGDWSPTYGADGRTIEGDGAALPTYATLAITGQSSHTWSSNTTELRALRRGAGTGRIAATWFASSSLTFDVNLADGASHQVSIYALDWDYQGRSQQIDILDGNSGAVLDTRTISGFTGGAYLKWNLTGHVKIKVTRLGGSNAVVSGLFFDPTA